ncbi:MAG: hypothetical protein ACE5EV_07020, partial [Gaiellales bacterium]
MATALALGVGLGAGVAQGAEVSIPSSPGTLTYTGAAGVNGVVVSLNGSGDYEFASAGGELITLDPSNDATLCTGGGTDTVTCAPGLVSALSVSLGDGDDTLTLASYADPVTFTGGGATDRLVAAAVAAGTIDLDDGAVTLSGQAADPVLSGVEEVSLTGTGGADVFDVAGRAVRTVRAHFP